MSTHITKTWFDGDKVVTQEIPESEVYKQEPVAWPCEIEEADFEQDTITLKMLTSQYVVRAGKHWLSTTPPAAQPCPYIRSTAEGTHHCALSQRQPLTDEQIERACVPLGAAMLSFTEVARAIEAAHGIKGKNT